MPNAVAFMPWTHIDAPITVGPLRLLPYERRLHPGNLPHMSQLELDGILEAYSTRPQQKVTRGIVVEYGDWQAGMEPSSEAIGALFRAKEFLSFSALSTRKFFGTASRYCCSAEHELVVQRYSPGSIGRFAFTTRRRDGGTSQGWSSDKFAFQMPVQISSHQHLEVDIPGTCHDS